MSNGTTTINTALASSLSGTPLTSAMQSAIVAAAQGGDATATYFQDQVIFNNLTSWLNSEGDNAWTLDYDTNGNPVYFAVQFGGPGGALQKSPRRVRTYKELMQLTDENAIYFMLETQPDTAVINGQQPPQQFTWNGQTYNIAGSLTATLSYNQEPNWYVQMPVGILDTIPMSVVAKVAWSNLIQPMLTGLWNGVKSAFSGAAAATDLAGVDGAVSGAADSALVEGAAVEGATINMLVGGLAFGGLVALAAIPFILDIIGHESYHTLKVYNLTPYNITWNLAYNYEGAMTAAPVTGQGSTAPPNYLIPAMSTVTPPGLNPVTMANEADFSFISASEYHGLGYVMSYTLSDPSSGSTLGTGAALFDVPFAGNNSLYATFDPGTDFQALYSTYNGQYQKTQMTATLDNPSVTMAVTYDYLSGEHPAPNGQNSYTYNSMVVFS